MPTTHGTTADGIPITDAMIETMADEAELGYDLEEIKRRSHGDDQRWDQPRHRSSP